MVSRLQVTAEDEVEKQGECSVVETAHCGDGAGEDGGVGGEV